MRSLASLLVRYVKATATHWKTLAVGAAVAVGGIVAGATDTPIRPVIWWTVVLVFTVTAQFKAWKDVQTKLDVAVESASQEAERAGRLVGLGDLDHETFNPSELCPGDRPSNGLVTYRTFTDCDIVGPCVIAPFGGTRFERCSFGGVPDNIYEIEGPRRLVGVVGFFQCTFVKCRFEDVGLMGSKEDSDSIRAIPMV